MSVRETGALLDAVSSKYRELDYPSFSFYSF